ncbi:MAG: TIM-barrel domain-containing protein [Bacteroidota bacterium]
MSYSFVNVNAFTPNTNGWTTIGNISSVTQTGNTFLLIQEANPQLSLQLSFLSATTFRVRFNPLPGFSYATETSVAVVQRNLGAVNLTIVSSDAGHIKIDTGTIQVLILLQPYQVQVYKGTQLINEDCADKNMVYIPGQQVVANFKTYPTNANYCGFGEKAGNQLLKNNFTMTFFNFDNFSYTSGIIPQGNEGGPLNPSEPLYASVPLLLEINNDPQDAYSGNPYAYGIFFDNPSQSYYNIGASDYSDMFGMYYFGALYGDMDYYFMYGDKVNNVLSEYTTLTGRSQMPPKYVFGFHQGGYGYYDSHILSTIANSYRAAQIPIDGLHIDVDFQDNYRTFTSSSVKFPNTKQYMDYLHSIGFKCSTNITPLLTANPYDENGNKVAYQQRDAMQSINGLIYDMRAGQGTPAPGDVLYQGTVSYGMNMGSNPYPVPPIKPNGQGNTPLGATGYYPDFSREDVRLKWGQQYQHLLQDVGMDMIWQDMTDPAIANPPANTFPLDLQQSDGTTFTPHAQVHNIYVLNLLRATTSGFSTFRPTQRTFIIARGGYAGMQRYAGLWTGDSASTWDFLQVNIPEVLNIGLSGIPISGCDIGGFANGSGPSSGTTSASYVSYGKVIGGITNYELLTRWMQLGAFLPWYRNHYNGYTKQFQEAYAYGEPVPTNCRKYIQLRYRMLQIFYDAMYEWTQTGMPIARALFLNDGDDKNVMNYLNDQFFVGKDILVAPIVTQHDTLSTPTTPLRDIYLPAGSQWYSFMDNQYPLQSPVPGGTLVTNYYAPLDLVPIYIRAGAILPMRQLEQYVGQMPESPLTINIYPGPDDSYLLYQDDGLTTDAEMNSSYRTTLVSHTTIQNKRTVILNRTFDQFTPSETFYFVALLGTTSPVSIAAGGTALPDVGTPELLASATANSYYWNQSIQITFMKIFDTQPTITLEATF